MTIPVTENKLTFSKVGGQPELTLSVRPRRTLTLGIGALWTLLWIAIGIWATRTLARVGAAGDLHGGAAVAAETDQAIDHKTLFNRAVQQPSSRAVANGPSGRAVGPKTGRNGPGRQPYSSARDARPDRTIHE